MGNKKPWVYRTALFPRVFTEKAFLYLVATKRREFLGVTGDKSLFYKTDKEPKKSGGFRDIYKPQWRLKVLLKRINSRVLSKLNFPNFVHCGPSGRSIVTAAKGHNKFQLHLSLDIKSFFDQVSEKTTSDILRKIGVNKEITHTIVKAAVEHNRLPQGFPTSPLLATLVVSYILQDFYFVFDREKILISVYADDILISSDDEEMIWGAKGYVEGEINKVGLKLNSKECFAKSGEQFTWLSLRIYPWVTLPRKELLSIEKIIYEYKETGIVPPDFKPKKLPKKPYNIRELWEESIRGKVVFAKSVSHTKLADKTLKKLNPAKVKDIRKPPGRTTGRRHIKPVDKRAE